MRPRIGGGDAVDHARGIHDDRLHPGLDLCQIAGRRRHGDQPFSGAGPNFFVLRGHELLELGAGLLPRLVFERHGTGALSLALVLARMLATAALPFASVEAVAGVFFRRGAALGRRIVHLVLP